MAIEKYGFVYVWRDKRNEMFYVGCHWGSESDRYVCSSERMRSAYRRRPEDFKRRVLQRIYTNRQDLLEAESKWLDQIKDEELGKRYYNLSKRHFGHWASSDNSMTVKEKLKAAWVRRKERGWKFSDETLQKMSENAIKNGIRPPSFKGKIQSQEARAKVSVARKGKPLSAEHCEKMRRRARGNSYRSLLWRCTYVDGRVVESRGRDSFGIPVITVKRLAKSGNSSMKHGILRIERV